MTAHLGLLSLTTSLVVAVLLATLPLLGSLTRSPQLFGWVGFAKPAAIVQFMLVVVSYICLTQAFLQDDFSIAYVANHSNSYLPLIYKVSGVWGGHEGSILLWILMLTGWTAAVALFSGNMPEIVVARVLSVMAMVNIGFLLFTLLTSNPFALLPEPAVEGRDLNPLLQDIGLAIHPPMLYMGYVGFSVAFAFAVAALISGRLDAAWARWSRPWTNIAWGFLTIGIALGSWWAYYELGWGGWWFWDPVENASFMPWLVGTALIHSLAATEKRGVFKAWTVLLAVMAFSLSLLGTFLVRSGVLTSVHAFATDPERGLFILVFLIIVVGCSLVLYAWRAPTLVSRIQFESVSREMTLLLNNVLLCILCFCVLLGTLYPLIHDALGWGKLSVGPPYFDTLFALLGTPLALLVGIGAIVRWKRDQISRIGRSVWVSMGVSVVGGLLTPLLFSHYSVMAAFGVSVGIWIAMVNLVAITERTRAGQRISGLRKTPRAFYGMVIAHFGMAMFSIGVTLTTVYSVEKDIRMSPADAYGVAGYEFVFQGTRAVMGPNYQSTMGDIQVFRNGQEINLLNPEKRVYLVQKNPMTEASIDSGFLRDLYVALGEPIDASDTWAVRIYYKPVIRWIWMGCFLMAFGGFIAAADKRYRRQKARSHMPVMDSAVAET
ncbi:MAG: heme lyase CcmF/NrfE family subunit [Pseudomonadota bacterium]